MEERTSLYLTQLSAADRKLLQLSVQMNPLMVANADGNYSLREAAAVSEVVRSLMSDPQFRPLILVAGHAELSDAALRVMLETHTKDIDGYLSQLADLLEQLPEDVAIAYRRFTLFAIIRVAEASRDGLFGLMGDRISQCEKSVMRKMVDALALEPNDEEKTKLGM